MLSVISIANLSKSYRLGQISGRTLSGDLNRWWARRRRKPDPTVRVGEEGKAARWGEKIWALHEVSFVVQPGEVLGIIGRNGAGKSTLLKILSRITAPTKGEIKVKGRIASLLEVGTGFHPELTGRENIFLNGAILGMTRQETARKFDEIVDFAEIEQFIDTPVKRYSSGMYVRLAFAVAAHLETEILLVDEVLAVGDAAFQKKCLGKMGAVVHEGRTVLFVSHQMAAIRHLCSRGILLEHGRLSFAGSAADTVAAYELGMLKTQADPQVNSAHVLYAMDGRAPQDDFAITRLELLDEAGDPKPMAATWDTIRFRIQYTAKKPVKDGSVVLQISDLFGSPLIMLSTRPDGNTSLSISVGEHQVDCTITGIPLAAGMYVVACGLAIPNKEWLTWNTNLALLQIHGKDVYQSGLAPNASRSLLAVPHRWDV
jgi:lipopolysaccharide transport system ATP-binding protein